jgi:hypothetical protein
MAATVEPIDQIVLGSDAASVTFSSIPSVFDDLMLLCSLRGTVNGTWGTFSVQLNNIDTSTYNNRRFIGSGSAVTSGADSNVLAMFGVANGATSTANTFSNCEFYFPDYKSSVAKTVSTTCAHEDNATLAYTTCWAQIATAVTSAITSIKIFDRYGGWGNCVAGSSFYLYGITKA